MKNHYVLRLLAMLLLVAPNVLAQTKLTVPTRSARVQKAAPANARSHYEMFAFEQRLVSKKDSIVCHFVRENAFTSVGPPKGFNDPRARKAATKATFIVEYIGYPNDARAAFQRAVDIWATQISSPVPIRVRAFWQPLGSGVLGSARPATYFNAPDGAQRARTLYPVALAEKVARRGLNSPDSADIIANFNSNFTWYYGLDARPTAGTFDLVSVVLHELGHGLGFTGGIFGDPDTREADVTPVTFDRFVENNTGQRLTDPAAFSTATAVYTQLTSRNLFFNGPVVQQKINSRPRLFAPATYDGGSTLYHLDEDTYRAGNPNSLMSPRFAMAEAIQDPGPITMAIFEDMEWKTTSLLHEPIFDTESTGDVVVTARVETDTTASNTPPQFFYRRGFPTQTDTTYRSANMTRVGTTNTFSYTLPAAEIQGEMTYYLRTRDGVGRTYSNPGRTISNLQLVYAFTTGPDRTPPTIKHKPDQNVMLAVAAEQIPVFASISDVRRIVVRNRNNVIVKQGIDTAYIEVQLNGVARPAVPLRYLGFGNVSDSTWANLITFPRNLLRAGDKISYRIVARDLASGKNQAISPATGFYEINVVAPQTAARAEFATDFRGATAANDFAGDGMSISTPTGFSKPSINTEHPYKNGADIFFESNYTYTLLAPIRIKSNPDDAKIRFDEIVLVEPGETGVTSYTAPGFYDYAIVEASRDGGATWQELLAGYDSRDRNEWLNAWNSRSSARDPLTGEVNSLAVGTPSLARNREFGLLDNGLFRPNDVILIRFRLFADALATGWGWQVDNLQVQTPKVVILANEPTLLDFSVYPNPTASTLRVTAQLSQPTAQATLTLSSANGQALRQLPIQVRGGKQISEQLDVSQLPTGLYLLQLEAGETRQVRKVMVTH
jgi:hypothetical protein